MTGTPGSAFKPKVVLYLRKSLDKSDGESLSYAAQRTQCLGLAAKIFPKGFAVKKIIYSNEKGTSLRRPHLLKALKQCAKHRAALFVGRPDRLARNIMIFSTLLMTPLTIFFASFPWLNLNNSSSADERASLLRAALEAHNEGKRISERALNIQPGLKRAMKKMGGRAHTAGSTAIRQQMLAEARRFKAEFKRLKEKQLSPAQIAANLNKRGETTPSLLPSAMNAHEWTAKRVRNHMVRVGLLRHTKMMRAMRAAIAMKKKKKKRA